MKTVDWKLLEELTQAPGAPGHEYEVRKIMEREIQKYTSELVSDSLGGIFGIKSGEIDSPRVLVAGHMDEVSFMITRISKEGYLSFTALGGWWSQVLLSQPFEVFTTSGKAIHGVIGSTPPHNLTPEERTKVYPMNKMFLDIGARDEEEVRSWGIREGCVMIPYSPYRELEGGHRLLSKAFDNRLGCAMSLEVLKELHKEELPNTLIAGATTQEEVGLRGAQTSAVLTEPDAFFAIDVSAAGDNPGAKDAFGYLGKGVLIRILDRTMITQPLMRDYLLDTAESLGIPYQIFVSQGGTDSGKVHLSGKGVPSATLGVCGRYIHSHTTIVDREDIEALKIFATELVRRFDNSTYQSLIYR
ncbi:Putative aminopeptidase FrvX [Thermoactinomyces sp. DSM 45891]|uniref:M42 family metallopeptidase n=1 Tax=Thermoactinomyces sp. DSM 45891 TaxID=1761907 RepID=UPI00091C4E5E|nr:M42 family metallopeptidase [Thermoactinomyces sp. DSM 45891]SFW98227.1 Putative aminopeptidase FrvX [Thermoactinomyces sp. DSM 45891]